MPAPVAIILGSAFAESGVAAGGNAPKGGALEGAEPVEMETRFGRQRLHRVERGDGGRAAYLLFRHGVPHRLLPNQIDYRAQAAALAEVGCGALLVTSSVGVLRRELPLYQPLLLGDLLTMDNRLPDGSACTMFAEASAGHGHLVLNDGLFSSALTRQVAKLAEGADAAAAAEDVVFGYVGGPRGKTAAENRMWQTLGAQVNSMTVAPEVILANELEIPCAALVVGHKYSVPGVENPEGAGAVAGTLRQSRAALRRVVKAFVEEGEAVPFGNHLFRFGDEAPAQP